MRAKKKTVASLFLVDELRRAAAEGLFAGPDWRSGEPGRCGVAVLRSGGLVVDEAVANVHAQLVFLALEHRACTQSGLAAAVRGETVYETDWGDRHPAFHGRLTLAVPEFARRFFGQRRE